MEDLEKLVDGPVDKRLLRNDGGAGPFTDERAGLSDGGRDVAGNGKPLEKARNQASIFAGGRDNDGPVIVSSGRILRWQQDPPV